MDEITKRLDRIIELLEVIADQEEEYIAYPITGSVSWSGMNLDDWLECPKCGRLIPPEGHCDCSGPSHIEVRDMPGLIRGR